MAVEKILVPDIGDDGTVEVIDIMIKNSDSVDTDQSLIVLESDKASMEIPSDKSGIIKNIYLKKGDKVKTGDLIADIEVLKLTSTMNKEVLSQPNLEGANVTQAAKQSQKVCLPDLGTDEKVSVIEILVKPGQHVEKDDSLLTLESDKASMDIPAEFSGTIDEVLVTEGQMVSSGDSFAMMTSVGTGDSVSAAMEEKVPTEQIQTKDTGAQQSQPAAPLAAQNTGAVYAGPSARKLARQLGIDINACKGTGKNARILVEDVALFAKSIIDSASSTSSTFSIASRSVPDFSKFGPVVVKDLSRIKQKTAQNLQNTHMTVPPVTQFDKADITNLELFRQENKKEIENQGGKLTMILFVMKALVASLKKYPQFNSSLSECGKQIIEKKYFHIGVAVDTPNGLVVPVVQNVDTKSILDLSQDLVEISQLARKGQLKPAQMQGSSMTISSLGGIGGTAFTPIVNWPDVAILGLSAIKVEPFYNGTDFEPRKMLPLSLSYDHRVIDGAEAARFIVDLKKNLEDLRRVLF